MELAQEDFEGDRYLACTFHAWLSLHSWTDTGQQTR